MSARSSALDVMKEAAQTRAASRSVWMEWVRIVVPYLGPAMLHEEGLEACLISLLEADLRLQARLVAVDGGDGEDLPLPAVGHQRVLARDVPRHVDPIPA